VVRGGLLLDLALAARVESTEDSVVVDPTPTGFAPADRLLAAVAVEPERSLDSWLDERRIGLRDVAEARAAARWEPDPARSVSAAGTPTCSRTRRPGTSAAGQSGTSGTGPPRTPA
jgi:hypothetical protein